MPIIHLQQRLREVGRIRMGDKGGRGQPQRLDRFRLTSADRAVLDEAAKLYGGEARAWAAEPGQFELYLKAEEIPVLVSPIEPTQWYEQWTGGGCTHRCDGATETIGDRPCQCDPENRACKITTRVSVMLPDLPSLGVWRLETHGYYAATELPMAFEILSSGARKGEYIPATLAIEQRTVKRAGQTKKFPVPVLRLRRVLSDVLSIRGQERPALDAPAPSGASSPALPPASAPVAPELPAPKSNQANQAAEWYKSLQPTASEMDWLDRYKAGCAELQQSWAKGILEARDAGCTDPEAVKRYLEEGVVPGGEESPAPVADPYADPDGGEGGLPL